MGNVCFFDFYFPKVFGFFRSIESGFRRGVNACLGDLKCYLCHPISKIMEIKEAVFVASYPSEKQCPKDGMPEFAFIGRSNVGKSSLINMLCARKGLAKVSGTPGKTRLLNFFRIDEKWYLVDLPGYGFAKVSKKMQKELSGMIDTYLLYRESMKLAFVLVDAGVPPQPIDLTFINNLGENGIPFAILFTKTDRLSKNELARNTAAFFRELKKTWETMPPHFITSAQFKTGRDEILGFIAKVLNTKE